MDKQFSCNLPKTRTNRLVTMQSTKKLLSGGFENQIKNKIVEVTGLSTTTINEYLSEEYKQEQKGGWSDETPRLVPASELH